MKLQKIAARKKKAKYNSSIACNGVIQNHDVMQHDFTDKGK